MSVVEYLWDTWSTVALQLLPIKHGFGQQLVERAGLSSFSPFDLMLTVGLLFIVYIIYRNVKDASREKKRFLEVYPQTKLELEESIRKLHALADKIDKVHRGCSITQVLAKTTGAASGALTAIGLTLAPVSAGLSLGLSATGLGLGAAAAVTSVSTTIVEKVSTALVEAEASELLPRSDDTENDIKSIDTGEDITEFVKKNIPRLFSVFMKSFHLWEVMKKNIDVIKMTKANPCLNAKSTKEEDKAFEGTFLAMTNWGWIITAITESDSLMQDIVSITEDPKHFQEGAKAEFVKKLRQQAQNLEQKLQELIRVHDILTQ
ncbi:apolipoprotein L3-like [Microtus pennsylvanicus]|uniref:apolipoprotein L3-like n=1 Tax=Microtus pennsylvanicus TaxID=10058 RepID=UPI003F6A62EA